MFQAFQFYGPPTLLQSPTKARDGRHNRCDWDIAESVEIVEAQDRLRTKTNRAAVLEMLDQPVEPTIPFDHIADGRKRLFTRV
jgi:hypothetical protein